MNRFQQHPNAPGFTWAVILTVTVLVLLEKFWWQPMLSSRRDNDVYPALLTFLVTSSKTIIPLFLLWKLAGLHPSCLGWVNHQGQLWPALWKGFAVAAGLILLIGLYQKYSSSLLFGTPYVSTGGAALENSRSAVAIAAALLNAVGEEILFRGMLLPVLLVVSEDRTTAILRQSLVFTVYHFSPCKTTCCSSVWELSWASVICGAAVPC